MRISPPSVTSIKHFGKPPLPRTKLRTAYATRYDKRLHALNYQRRIMLGVATHDMESFAEKGLSTSSARALPTTSLHVSPAPATAMLHLSLPRAAPAEGSGRTWVGEGSSGMTATTRSHARTALPACCSHAGFSRRGLLINFPRRQQYYCSGDNSHAPRRRRAGRAETEHLITTCSTLHPASVFLRGSRADTACAASRAPHGQPRWRPVYRAHSRTSRGRAGAFCLVARTALLRHMRAAHCFLLLTAYRRAYATGRRHAPLQNLALAYRSNAGVKATSKA